MDYYCTLNMVDISCKHRKNGEFCKGYTSCGFCKEAAEEKPYRRKERWYEKYYKKDAFL